MTDVVGPADPIDSAQRANVIGAGLIGGSIAMALRAQGWRVSISDVNSESASRAVEVEAADEVGFDHGADLTVIATPVSSIPDAAKSALEKTSGMVTDVGSTKAEICAAVRHSRFVGGHPMAGSEQDGIAGARADLFEGAVWVLTPTDETDERIFARVRGVIRRFGAEVMTLPPATHDALVAQVSHVPHLTAAALMNLADGGAVEHRALLRLAAGGFRDMTRISAGRAVIWPDICVANSTAIVGALDDLVDRLQGIRAMVDRQDKVALFQMLDRARTARLNLPVGYGTVEQVTEIAVPIPDRPGELAAITTLAAELDVNILDLGISHSGEGRQGTVSLVVDANKSERLMGGLMARRYNPTVQGYNNLQGQRPVDGSSEVGSGQDRNQTGG